MLNERIWKVSVSELLVIFRDSLLALIPVLERAQIKWRDEDAYDDWDEIANSIFKNIIVRSIIYSEACKDSEINFTEYDICYSKYNAMSFIRIINAPVDNGQLAIFVGYSTNANSLDYVKYVVTDESGETVVTDAQKILNTNLDFVVVIKDKHGNSHEYTTLNVEL